MVTSAQSKSQLSKSCNQIVKQGGEVMDCSEGQQWIIFKKQSQKKISEGRSLYTLGLYDVKSGKTTVLSDDNCIFVVKSPKSKSGDVRITEEYAWYDEDGVLVDASSKEDIIMPDDKMLISQLTNEEGTVSDYLKVIPLGTSKAKKMEIELAKSPYTLVETTNLVDKDGQTSILHICNETFDMSPLRKVTIESNNTFSYYRNAEQVFDGDMLTDTKYQRVVCNTDGEIVEVGKVMTYQEALQASENANKPQLSLK
jgi:hypothetical protein